MSQVENTRHRSGQIVRPAAFSGQPGTPQAPHPSHPMVDPGQGYDCDRQMCGCGSAYCGPGQEFCWYCMKQMMVKEIACLLKTDPELQAILNAPKMGVTDGAAQVPGQIGEYLAGNGALTIPALTAGQNYTTYTSPLVVPAGEWLLSALGWGGTFWSVCGIAVNPMPPGLISDLAADLYVPSGQETILNASNSLLSCTTPTLLPFECWFQGATGGSVSAAFNVTVQAWRMR